MTNVLWGVFLAFTAAILLGVSWRYVRLRRKLFQLAEQVRRHAEGQPGEFPVENSAPLQALVGAIAALERAAGDERARLAASHGRLLAVLEQIADGVLLIDAQGVVTYANATAHRLFDESGLLTGRSLAEVLRHYQMIAAWQEALEKDAVAETTIESGREGRVLHVIAAPDRTVPGGALLLVQDVTRLHQLERVRRNFISNFSHEIRTPLAAIRALSETLQTGALDDPPAARRFLARIVTEVDALTQMAQELLDLTRIESGKLTLAREDVSPAAMLRDAAARMRIQAERAGLTLRVQAEDDLPSVYVDAGRLGQVLLNLLHNAVKFTPAGGVITLSASAHEDEIWLSVRDTGVGIPAEALPHIFERFYKVDRARNSGGTGLGLAIVRHIVAAHGGRVWAESVEGEGSEFIVALPLLKER